MRKIRTDQAKRGQSRIVDRPVEGAEAHGDRPIGHGGQIGGRSRIHRVVRYAVFADHHVAIPDARASLDIG